MILTEIIIILKNVHVTIIYSFDSEFTEKCVITFVLKRLLRLAYLINHSLQEGNCTYGHLIAGCVAGKIEELF